LNLAKLDQYVRRDGSPGKPQIGGIHEVFIAAGITSLTGIHRFPFRISALRASAKNTAYKHAPKHQCRDPGSHEQSLLVPVATLPGGRQNTKSNGRWHLIDSGHNPQQIESEFTCPALSNEYPVQSA
jgi:hypothetical protein